MRVIERSLWTAAILHLQHSSGYLNIQTQPSWKNLTEILIFKRLRKYIYIFYNYSFYWGGLQKIFLRILFFKQLMKVKGRISGEGYLAGQSLLWRCCILLIWGWWNFKGFARATSVLRLEQKLCFQRSLNVIQTASFCWFCLFFFFLLFCFPPGSDVKWFCYPGLSRTFCSCYTTRWSVPA